MKLQRIWAGLVCALLWTSASAAPIAYQFDIRWAAGPLAGQIDTGLFLVDGLDCGATGTCTGTFSPGNAARTLLGFTIEIDGRVYTAANDLGFPAFPQITFSLAGLVTNIDYDGLVSGRELQLGGSVATYFPPGAPSGPLRSFGFVQSINRVAEPTSLALLGSALLVAPWLRRRLRPVAA